jgi:hypothetical protein
VNDDRITHHQLSRLTHGRDRPAAHAMDNAARGVNATEHAIRQITGMIRAKLTETEMKSLQPAQAAPAQERSTR